MRMTINGAAAKLGVERDVAYSLVKFLEAVGLAKKTGETEKPAGNGKGKGSDIYSLDENLAVNAARFLTKLGS